LPHPLIIITKEKKEDYINSLKASHKHKNTDIITSFFFKMSISRMNDELLSMQNKIPNTVIKKGGGMSFIF